MVKKHFNAEDDWEEYDVGRTDITIEDDLVEVSFFLFRPLKMKMKFVFGCVIFFFAFSIQNLVRQIIIRRGLAIYHIEALSVVI